MKGISTIIATILLVIITISLTGTAYLFMGGVLTGGTTEVFEIVDITNNKVIVRNRGTKPIEDFKVMVDGNEVGSSIEGGSIQPNDVGTVILQGITEGRHDIIVGSSSMSLTWKWEAGAANIIFSDDMESGVNGWTHGGTNDQWEQGTPIGMIVPICCHNNDPNCQEPSSAHSSNTVWGTDVGGCYLPSSNDWLKSPEISLSGLSDATLKFWMAYQFEDNGYDWFYIEASSDGTNFDILKTININPQVYQDWAEYTYSLNSYAGGSVWIRYRFTSDGSWEWTGFYIDDVQVSGY